MYAEERLHYVRVYLKQKFKKTYNGFLEIPNRSAIGYEQYTNPSVRNDRSTNVNNRSPVRGPLRGCHRATEE